MKKSERLIWFVIGAAIGAGVALLYAPKAGKDTRRLIRRKAEDACEAISETSGQLRDTLVDTGETILDKSRDVLERGKRAAGI